MRNIAAETRTTGLPFSSEEFIQLVEDLRGSGQSLFVVPMREGDAGHERGNAGGLVAFEGRVLEVDVVDDLAEGADGFVGDAEAVAEDFEGAAAGVVGELRAG